MYPSTQKVPADVYELLMEYSLMRAIRTDCLCNVYLYERRGVLIPEIIAMAREKGKSPVDIFVEFQNRLHERHKKQA